jgi:hypothetical protein
MTTERLDGLADSDPIARPQRRIVSLRRWRGELPDASPGSWEPRVYRGGVADGHGELDLTVRPARLHDVFHVARMPRTFELNQPDLLLHGYSLARSSLRSSVPLLKSRPKLFVALSGDRLVGFIHCQTAYPDQRWHVVAIGTATGVFDAAPVEDALIRFGVTAAGLRGVKRVYARAVSGSDLLESFQRVAFSPYATETVFSCDAFQSGGGRVELRAQEASDTWAIHQLYSATAPREVQYAEAYTSHRWDVTGPDEFGRASTRYGWMVDDGHALAAYARVSCSGGSHLIELLYQPDHRDALEPMLDSVVTALRARGKIERLLCSLRGYQVDAASALERRGFDPVLEQDLLVKYTTATARAPQPEPAAVHADVIERLPKRVPSFLHQKPSDEVAG